MRGLIKDGNNERLKIIFFFYTTTYLCNNGKYAFEYSVFMSHFTTEIQIKIVEIG